MTNSRIAFEVNAASEAQVARHLGRCEADFVPPLGKRVDVHAYARKIVGSATRFEAWDGVLVGLLAAYCNDPGRDAAFVTSVSVLPEWRGKGVASHLIDLLIAHARGRGFRRVELEVDRDNAPARRRYERAGFVVTGERGRTATMCLTIEDPQMSANRDYDVESQDVPGRRYAYDFDLDVMHPLLVRSFEPFFKPGGVLELGSFRGDFTRRLLGRFDDVTCVEASAAAIEEARRALGAKVEFFNEVFEKVRLPRRYANVVMTHVLEHLDDPVLVLRRINEEWLDEGGRLFLVCPNANAPSRQIAVKMGIITHNAAVTPAEAEHGHRRTYSLDTLERDALRGGLEVLHRSGIFFKALANFQWDQVLEAKIVSGEYLEGCYALGQAYPDLCASIFLLCGPGAKPPQPAGC